MPWEWSHTPTAYANAYENLSNCPLPWLIECYAEIVMEERGWDYYQYPLYQEALMIASDLAAQGLLIEAIWEFASNQRTCDNSGYNAWMCPDGCHTVSFEED